MGIGRLMKGIFALLAILFVTFQPVMVPVAYAIESWTGNPWEGNPWEGDPWDGSDLEWEGKSWTGKGTEGKDWTGKGTDGTGTEGNTWNGYDWESLPWYLEGWSKPGFEGNIWNSPTWVGNGSTGSPWLNPGWTADGFQGNSWLNPAWNGYSTSGNTWAGPYGLGSPWIAYGTNGYGTVANPWEIPGWSGEGTDGNDSSENTSFYETDEFNISKYIIGDVIGGQATMISGAMKYQRFSDVGKKGSGFGFGGRMYGNILVNGLKLGGVDNTAVDAYDTASKIDAGIQGYKSIQEARNVGKTTDEARDATKAFRSAKNLTTKNNALSIVDKIPKPPAVLEKALSKFNVPAAALGTVASTAKTVDSWGNASEVLDSNATGAEKTAAVADVTANIGDTAMNAGVVTAALPIPGARVVGGVMVAGGAALWAVSKGTKLIANNWESIKETAKKTWEGTKNLAKKGWNTLTGIFS